jgi:predicted 3-demethylubiquinone-9 3-methyltransferase (glyoxalase superfamily)
MPTITPHLWFDNEAEEAANLYTSIFANSKIHSVNHFGDGEQGEIGTAMTVNFELEGQQVIALNAGPHFKLNEAFSFFVSCDSQEEVDELWSKLTADGGEESQCGWLKDKFGVSWQIIPNRLMELMQDEDKEAANRVMKAMMEMQKIDVPTLEKAYAG